MQEEAITTLATHGNGELNLGLSVGESCGESWQYPGPDIFRLSASLKKLARIKSHQG